MAHGRGRVWAKRAGLAAGVLAVAVGGFAGMNWAALNARYADYRFRTAPADDVRAVWAAKLVGLGPVAAPYLADALKSGEPASTAVALAAAEFFAAVPASDPRFADLARPLLAAAGSEPAAAGTLLPLVPEMMACPDADVPARCRELVRAGLAAPSPDARVRAVRLSLRPDLSLKADAVPLLDDPEPEVRRAAMLAVGPATGGANVIEDEALFKWLHDPDLLVRDVCAAALKSRGLDDTLVGFARKLSSPDPTDRLRLLLDLRFAPADVVRDPGPWLERLSRDADPGVRAGAARVAFECRLSYSGWAARLADGDPDPTVRRLAGYYRGQADAVRQTSGTEE